MRVKVELIVESTGQPPKTVEVTTLGRASALAPGSLGLHISEATALLEATQQTMVAAQVDELFEIPIDALVAVARCRAKGTTTSSIERSSEGCG